MRKAGEILEDLNKFTEEEIEAYGEEKPEYRPDFTSVNESKDLVPGQFIAFLGEHNPNYTIAQFKEETEVNENRAYKVKIVGTFNNYWFKFDQSPLGKEEEKIIYPHLVGRIEPLIKIIDDMKNKKLNIEKTLKDFNGYIIK